jgi:deoxyribonuclease V
MPAPDDHSHRNTHRWDVTPAEARDIQRELRARLVTHPPPGFAPRLIAGADVSMDLHGTRGYAGIVVIDAESMETVDQSVADVELDFPYIPGLLSFREIPALLAAWERLATRPDVVIFDGVGYAHPRRFGLACHGGMTLGVPSVGCAKSILVGRYDRLGEERGATAPMTDRGELVGMAVRTRSNVQPVYVSIGDHMDLDTAVSLVLRMAVKYREPETTRRAHRLVNERRRAAQGR